MRSALLAAALVSAAATVSAQIRFPFSRQPRQHDNTNGATTSVRSARTKDDGNTNINTNDRRRALSVKLFLAEDWTYVVNASVGTPPQNLTLSLAPAASESWVMKYDDYYDGYDYYGYGAFAPGNSSTFESVENDTFSAYGDDGSFAYGDRVRETLWLGGGPLSNVTMGLVTSASTQMGGVLALGFNESSSSSSSSSSYAGDVPNVPDHLLASGLVNSTAYSLWLDDASAGSGHVLFGAVDRAAFEPPLIRIPTMSGYYGSNYYYDYSGWNLPLASLNYSRSAAGALQQPLIANQTALQDVVVAINPTFSVSILPFFLAQPIWDLAGAAYDSDFGMALAFCDAASNITARLALQLYGADGPVINIPVSDLVLDSDWVSSDPDTDAKRCRFGVQNGTDSSEASSEWYSYDLDFTLGAPMLKRTYTVFDLASQEMGFASVNSGRAEGEGDDIVPFPSYAAEIPESTLATACNGCSDDGSTNRGSSHDDDYDPGLSGGVLIGVVVGCIVAGTLVTLGIIFGALACARRRQMARMAAAEDKEKGPAASGEAEQLPPLLPPRPPMTVSVGGTDVPQASMEGEREGNVPVHERNEVTQTTAEQAEGSGAGTTRAVSQADADRAEATEIDERRAKDSQVVAVTAEASQPNTGQREASRTQEGAGT
ncbi:hypothetical protein SLS62_010684 [Diatrype stigma]|uniref:Peptidase A1 domain-containing protein n=1 Tax=Diatrype stigma TaxID=117547 RepID=A0AAN9YHS5_9PEZI